MDNGVNSVFCMGVGGKHDVLSGHIKAGTYVDAKSQSGMDLFRVTNEPKRLFKRYFVGMPLFIKVV